jgi:hypothetical protein
MNEDGSNWVCQTFNFGFDAAICVEAGDIDKNGKADLEDVAELSLSRLFGTEG